MLALDISNYNTFTPAYARQLKDQDVGHIIVRGGLGFEHPGLIEIARRQLQIAKDAGQSVDVYGWAYFNSADPEAFTRELVERYDEFGPLTYWIDCEADGWPDAARNVAWLHQCVTAFSSLGKRVGIYTGRWWWADHWMGNTTVFSDLPLWAATDDKNPDLKFIPFGGWDHLAIEQYDLSGPDRDVVDDDFLHHIEGVKLVTIPTVAEQLSYLGGLTHDVIPQCITELEAALGAAQGVLDPEDPMAVEGHIERVLTALRENAS